MEKYRDGKLRCYVVLRIFSYGRSDFILNMMRYFLFEYMED